MTTLTENGALAHSTSGNPLVDIFFSSVRGIVKESLKPLMLASLENNRIDTALLILHTRDCRNGKGERTLAYDMMDILNKYDETLYFKILKPFVETYGRFEDYLELDLLIRNQTSNYMPHPELDMFIEKLREDIDNVGKNKISLASKWSPSEKGYYKFAHNYIAKYLTSGKKGYFKEYRQIISKLRAEINVVETKMSANDWDNIDYETVPSQAIKLYGRELIYPKSKGLSGAFYRHSTKYTEYLKSVKTGEKKINIKGLLPHQLIHEYITARKTDDVIECQWNKLLEEVTKNQTLSNSTALVDVSGSMSGIPMEVAIALGLIIAELTDGTVITFSEIPEFFKIQGTSLYQKLKSIISMKWGMNTNFYSAMNLILQKAIITGKCPDTLFVFSDMQFDIACGNTTYQHDVIEKMFLERGFNMPKMVYWNLSGKAGSLPATLDSNGTIFISGFNPNLIKTVLNGKSFNPVDIINDIIEPYRFNILM